MTVPTAGTGTSADGQSIVTLDADADAPLFKAFAEDRVRAYLTEHPRRSRAASRHGELEVRTRGSRSGVPGELPGDANRCMETHD